VFVAEYIASEELRREIHEGSQVVENWNSANTDLFYGSSGTLGGSDSEHQEVSMLLPASAPVRAGVHQHPAGPVGPQGPRLAEEDDRRRRRGLSPLFWSNANLYGTIDIEMDRHLDLGLAV
jgi:hypothetical protein